MKHVLSKVVKTFYHLIPWVHDSELVLALPPSARRCHRWRQNQSLKCRPPTWIDKTLYLYIQSKIVNNWQPPKLRQGIGTYLPSTTELSENIHSSHLSYLEMQSQTFNSMTQIDSQKASQQVLPMLLVLKSDNIMLFSLNNNDCLK